MSMGSEIFGPGREAFRQRYGEQFIFITVAILAQDGVQYVDALCYVCRAVLLATRADMCCLGVRTAQHSVRSIAVPMHARAAIGWHGGAYDHALPTGDMRLHRSGR